MARSLLVLVLGVSVCQLESALIGSHSSLSSSSSSSNYILFDERYGRIACMIDD